jgi:endonuclease/exonuclease/phosphatase family metal-dependent hydrolase
MRITSLNLQGYEDWQERQPAIIAYLRAVQPDIVIMQEDVYLPDISPLSPSEALNKELHFPFRHSAITRLQTSPLTPYYREGLTIFSKLPVTNSQSLILKQDPLDEHQRIIQCFDVQTEHGIAQLANIHLSIEDNFPFPVAQLEELLEILSQRGEQRIIGGDFNIRNLEAHQALWAEDYTATTTIPYISYPAENKRIDYFLVPNRYTLTNLAVSTTEHLSDHRTLTIDIATAPPRQQPAIIEQYATASQKTYSN